MLTAILFALALAGAGMVIWLVRRLHQDIHRTDTADAAHDEAMARIHSLSKEIYRNSSALQSELDQLTHGSRGRGGGWR